MPVPVADPVLARSLAEQDAAPQSEYAYAWREPCLVEPVHGYVVTGPGRLVEESVPYSWHVGLPPQPPGPPAVQVPALVSLRDDGDGNYYHFLDDVLGRLVLFDRLGVDPALPLLIRASLARRPYFVAALAMSPRLRARRWLVQEPGQTVGAGEVVFGKALPHSRSTLEPVADLLQPAPPPGPDEGRRVLLVRDPARGRHLRNAAEVQQVCVELGFEVVDADRLDLAAQVALFAAARHVVGPHGAGLVNLLWRRGRPASLLELFPPDASPAHYHWLCSSFGFAYDALRGSEGSTAGGFTVDADRLAAALHRQLEG